MAKASYVYSTLSQDVAFAKRNRGQAGGPASTEFRVVIRGGANVMAKRTLVTKLGERTEVTAEQLAFLEEDVRFKRFVANGFLKVMAIREDADEVAQEMEAKDKSAQKTPDAPEFKGKKPKLVAE